MCIHAEISGKSGSEPSGRSCHRWMCAERGGGGGGIFLSDVSPFTGSRLSTTMPFRLSWRGVISQPSPPGYRPSRAPFAAFPCARALSLQRRRSLSSEGTKPRNKRRIGRRAAWSSRRWRGWGGDQEAPWLRLRQPLPSEGMRSTSTMSRREVWVCGGDETHTFIFLNVQHLPGFPLANPSLV